MACGTFRRNATGNRPQSAKQPHGADGPPPTRPSISDFSISRVKPGVIWTVSSNGQIYNTMDHGKTWNNVSNIADVPPHTQLQHDRSWR